MLSNLSRRASPLWLRNIAAETNSGKPLRIKILLRNSLYYPSCGFDGDPIKYFAGNIHSFIYSDYGRTEGELLQALADPGFLGYEAIATRSVTAQELNWPEFPMHLDGNFGQDNLADYIRQGWIKSPFCSWSIFQRCSDRGPGHGPSRFSLLYLCADGIAAYQALYVANSVAPKAIAVIQPGHGFGSNWTNFEDPNEPLARAVATNRAGRPELLLYGGMGSRDSYPESCWPEYRKHICFLDTYDQGTIGVWGLSTGEHGLYQPETI